MNVVALNASTPAAADQLADLAVKRASSQPLTGAALRNAAPEVQRAEVAKQFEAILVRQLLAPTMTSLLGDSSGAAGSVYGDLMTSTFATQLTHGTGLGLSRLLEQQLTPHSSVSTATSATSATTTPTSS